MKRVMNLHPAWIATIIAIAVGLWLVSGIQGDQEEPATGMTTDQPQDSSPAGATENNIRVRVQVIDSQATPMTPDAIISARTVPFRAVTLRGETSGKVVDAPLDKGDHVKKGTVIAKLAIRDRVAQRKQAEAILKQRRLQYDAAKRMHKDGYQTEVDLAQAQANLEIAEADLQRIREDIGHTVIRAPFDGVLEQLHVDVGDFVSTGGEIGRIVQQDPFLVRGTVSEDVVTYLEPGQSGTVTLVDGRELAGTLFFVATEADAQTRSFTVELKVSSAGEPVVLGASARMLLPLDEVMAHEVEPSIMTLNEAGEFGIKSVDDNDTVHFHPAKIAQNRGGMVWLADLPEQLRIIRVGQGFVEEGDPVEVATPDEPAADSDEAAPQ